MNDTTVMTSVKVNKETYELFKKNTFKTRFYLQDLVNRSMYLYLNDEQYRNTLNNFSIPVLSEQPLPPSLVTPTIKN